MNSAILQSGSAIACTVPDSSENGAIGLAVPLTVADLLAIWAENPRVRGLCCARYVGGWPSTIT